MVKFSASILFLLASLTSLAQNGKEDSAFVRENYNKIERMIPMRDGMKLFTAIYVPKDDVQKYPILMVRTPYSCQPYGEEKYPRTLSYNSALVHEKYIFVQQDVRGRYMSEGKFEEMTPHKALKKSKTDTDESSDTFDTIEWLLKNLKTNNGRAGIYGISYPGFYATASLPSAHPALKAVSPQAPVSDEFAGDDVYHNGAFFLMDNFSFMSFFDYPRPGPWKEYPPLIREEPKNAYQFYQDVEPLSRSNSKYFKDRSKIWNEIITHNTYDDFWKARNIRPHLTNIKPAVLIVGGWFDAEDLFGPLHTYQAIEQSTPTNNSRIIMGPWTHGAWARRDWSTYDNYTFNSNTSSYFKEIESGFFNFYLKDKGTFSLSEATTFITGSNVWKSFTQWPPRETIPFSLFLSEKGKLSFSLPQYESASDEFVSDPAKPVPYSDTYGGTRVNEYMGSDQRFASTRPDVLVYESDVLGEELTFTGPLKVNFYFSTSGTDADFVVKLIDVLPDDTPNPEPNPKAIQMAAMQQQVRADVLRGKFRNSLEKPEPFVPGEVTEVTFQLNDIAHTFKKGHRIMVQVQSSWFPLVDINPQKFMDISKATEEDFQKATHRFYSGNKYPSRIEIFKLR